MTCPRSYRRAQPKRFALILAVFALLSMVCLTTWHDSIAHDHMQASATVLDHDHEQERKPGLADQLHVSAHAVHTVDVPAQPWVEPRFRARALVGTSAKAQVAAAVPPDTLLRPPRG